MTETSFINPFSDNAKEIVSKLGRIENLDKENSELIKMVDNTGGQELSRLANIPLTIKQLAERRFEWYLFRKFDKFNNKDYEFLFNPDIYEFDVVSFYLLCQAVAIGYGPDSHEAKQVIEAQSDLIDKRLKRIKSADDKYKLISETLDELIDTFNVHWTNLKDVLEIGELNLDDLLLSNGKVVIEYDDFFDEYSHLIEYRDPHSMYKLTCGMELKFKLLKSIIMLHTKQYISTVYEMSKRMVEPNPILKDLASSLKEMQQKAQEIKYSSNKSNEFDNNKPIPYEIEAFPPCVRKCMRGIKSGGRNDAIVLFLTPFISYARLYPGIFSQEQTMKISDVDPSLEITHNEVIAMIYDAAMACSPPLFKDQPQEKININSKLGFGMHMELKLDNEGETQWYTPMSCEKIKLHMSSLCTPNIDCKKIGNPLTYYNRKRRIMKWNNGNKNEQVNTNGN